MNKPHRLRYASLLLLPMLALALFAPHSHAAILPDPKLDTPPAAAGEAITTFAGGCFWGLQDVFQHVKGVKSVTAGYAGGKAETAEYETVSTGATGHAESVSITYDPAQVSFGQLLKVYFSVAHDPTELNRQGPDSGTQYRSEIFYADEAQHKTAAAYIAQLDAAKAFPASIVTKLEPLKQFYPAEAYHQNYAAQHPMNPYIMINDAPKVAHLKETYPSLYQ